jgi:general secretion pathway protein G
MKSTHRGFTLLELLVVLLILGLLAGFVGPKYFSQIGRSEQTIAKSQIDAFGKALDQYRLDVGRFPSTDQGLAALFVAPSGEGKWRGPYLKKAVPADPWGNPYQYQSPGADARDYDIVSLGRDATSGGTGEDADVTSWN